jgi:hypothetical protein
VNTQCIFLDALGRAYLFDDSGRMLRFDPERQRLEELPHFYPHENYQSAWHGVLYDAVSDPRSGAVYMIPWKGHAHLARFWPMDGAAGRLEDLGPLTQERDPCPVMSVNLDHVGGLIWGADNKLYLVKAEWTCEVCGAHTKNATFSMLMRFDPERNTWERLGSLSSDKGLDYYVSRGALSARGNMVFGKILASPAGAYRVTVPDHPRALRPDQFLRLWG